MKEIPMLFSTPMVSAILDKRKAQTRRLVKWPKVPEWHDWDYEPDTVERRANGPWWPVFNHKGFNKDISGPVKCPYGQLGDLLYVRETWFPAAINGNRVVVGYHDKDPDHTHEFTTDKVDFYWKQLNKGRMIPSIHMPKEAARIWLQKTATKVERACDISEADAIAEGVEQNRDGSWHDYLEPNRLCQDTAKASFQSLWCKINGTETWNSWVWANSFDVLSTTGKPSLLTEKIIS